MSIDVNKIMNLARKEYFDFARFKMPIVNDPAYGYMLAITLLEIWGEELYGVNDYVEGPYEYGQVRLMPKDIVIDCGANLGLFSLLAHYRGAQAYAIEPMQKNIEVLQEVRNLNPWAQFKIIEKAVSNAIGQGSFYINSGDLGNATICPDLLQDRNVNTEVKIDITTIDDIMKTHYIPYVSFIKADIEGAEEQMLLGAEYTLKNYQPKLAICTYHTPDSKKRIEEIIKTINPKYTIIHQWNKLFAY